MPDAVTSPPRCRLCDGALEFRFKRTVLGRHEVGYFRCAGCGSLQTETPYWLDEAYADRPDLPNLDTGAAQRNLQNLTLCYLVARLFKARNIVDLGGGDGLLCRLLRDYGLNAFSTDKYATPTYSRGFNAPDFAQPDAVVSFEVFEHLSNPGSDLEPVFAGRPRLVLASTEAFTNQPQDWWYLVPEGGQHVFFYSPAALDLIAARYGYRRHAIRGYHLFLRDDLSDDGALRRLRFLMHPRVFKYTHAWMSMRPAVGVGPDFDLQTQAMAAAQGSKA